MDYMNQRHIHKMLADTHEDTRSVHRIAQGLTDGNESAAHGHAAEAHRSARAAHDAAFYCPTKATWMHSTLATYNAHGATYNAGKLNPANGMTHETSLQRAADAAERARRAEVATLQALDEGGDTNMSEG